MKKKTAKKLVLSKETVLRLEEELKGVRGGWSDSCTCTFTCGRLCPRMPDTLTSA